MKKNKRGVRLLPILLVVVLLLAQAPAFAAAGDVEISDIAVEDGLAKITVQNHLASETLLTVTVKKDDNSLILRDKVYAVRQQTVEAKGEATFFVLIPDEKRGIDGSGVYAVEIRNSGDGHGMDTFLYATESAIGELLADLKTAAAGVTDPDKAYEALLPIVTNLQNKAVLIDIGMDYDSFIGEVVTLQQEAMQFLYQSQLAGMSNKEVCDALLYSYALAVYSTGDKAKAMAVITPEYDGKKTESALRTSAAVQLTESFIRMEDFKNAFLMAYGLETINAASVDGMEEVLEAFERVTGEGTTEIQSVGSLPTLKAYKVYEYMVSALQQSKVTTVLQLTNLLDAGYRVATASSTTGGGGGTSGGVGNQAPINSGSVSVPMGSGTEDTPVDTGKRVFTDLPVGHWAEGSIKALKAKGIVNGTPEGAYEPERAVTREEFTKMLVLACGLATDNGETAFSDVDSSAWYAPYIRAAAEQGIVYGMSEAIFGVGENISRQDMAVMTKRALDRRGVTLSKLKNYNEFSDHKEIADYALASIQALYEAGIVKGKGENTFEPNGIATRAEVAKIIYEAWKGEL